MTYRKQTWRDYDDTKTEHQNRERGAVVTPERLNHIETGIANSADKQEVTAQLAQNEQQLKKKPDKAETGWATFNSFDEPTRATLQGLDKGQINAVLGYRNVKPINIDTGAVRLDNIDEDTKSLLGIKEEDGYYKHGQDISDVGGRTTTESGTTRIDMRGFSSRGVIEEINLRATEDGEIEFKIFERKSSDTHFKSIYDVTLPVKEGLNNLIVDIPVDIGQFIGYYSSNSDIVRFSNSSSRIAYLDGNIDENTSFQTTSREYMLQLTIRVSEASKLSGYIHPREIDGVTYKKSPNLFNKENTFSGGYYQPENGEWQADTNYHSSEFIPVSLGEYVKPNTASYVLWDKNKSFLGGGPGRNFTVDSPRVKYVTLAVRWDFVNSFMLVEGDELPSKYIPFKEEFILDERWDITGANDEIESSVITEKMLRVIDGVTYKKSPNLFNKENAVLNGYYQPENGVWEAEDTLQSSEFIPVSLGEYSKTNTISYVLWDKNKSYLKGETGTSFTVDNPDIKYVTVAVRSWDVDSFMLVEGDELPEQYIPFEDEFILDKRWNITGANIGAKSSANSSANSEVFLRIPSPYSDNHNAEYSNHQVTHPSVVQFENEWNGYKYWLGFTPYPSGNDQRENPCIAVSNDGVRWVVPTGLNNPLDVPHGSGGVGNYNSDTHLFFNGNTQKLELWYRAVSGNNTEILKRRTSSDGIIWSDVEEMVSKSGSLNYISPSLLFENGKYKMWAMTDWNLRLYESLDGKNWSDKGFVTSEGKNIHTWHSNVIKHEGKYYLLNCDKQNTLGSGGEIKYAESDDGINFTEEKTIITFTGNEWDYDGLGVYRGSLIIEKDSVKVLYGMWTKRPQGTVWTTGMASGRDIYNLRGLNEKGLDYYS